MNGTEPSVQQLQQQLRDTVKQYEGKLATLSVFNDALQKENTQLRDELEESSAPRSATEEDVIELKQEFTRRMATADRDNARLKDKIEQLKRQLSAVSQGGNSTQARLRDREAYITSLQAEGEALARKNGELESALRKSRASAKESETERERLQSRLRQLDDLLSQERERFDMNLAHSSQQIAQLQESYDALQQQAQEQINAALHDGTNAAQAAAQAAEKSTSAALEAAFKREEELQGEIEGLRAANEAAEQSWSRKAESFRREVTALEAQLRQQESDVTDAVTSASEGTRPLLRQIESMAASARSQEHAHAEAERRLLRQLDELEDARRAAVESDAVSRAKLRRSETNHTATQKALAAALQALSEQREKLEAEKRAVSSLQSQLASACAATDKASAALQEERAKHEAAQNELHERVWEAQEQVQRLSSELEQLRNQLQLFENSRNRLSRPSSSGGLHQDTPALPISTSSHVLKAQNALHSRTSSQKLPGAEPHEGGDELEGLFRFSEHNGSDGSALANGFAASSSGDVGREAALLSRLNAAEAMAEQADKELLLACQRAESAQADAKKLHSTLQDMQALQARHEMALELLGERNERVETLEDDVREMKHIFHSQLSALVDELNALRLEQRGAQ